MSRNFTDADFRKLRNSGIDVFHPAVAFDAGPSDDVTLAWFEKRSALSAVLGSYFFRQMPWGGTQLSNTA